nr:cyclic nucleotide-binding domain-containing protein [uncultured Pedobacter sp.]
MNKKVFARLIAMLTKVKPLHPLLEPYLWDNMVPLFCKKNTPLHEQDDVVDKAYFIGRGYILIYYIEDGKKHVLRICGADEIIAGKSFMSGTESRYYVSAVKDTYLLAVTARQMQVAYETIPETEELARLVLSSFEEKELKRDEMIRKGGEESVLHFYTTHPDLLHGKVILLEDVASYLLMTTKTLRLVKKKLIEKGFLPEG